MSHQSIYSVRLNGCSVYGANSYESKVNKNGEKCTFIKFGTGVSVNLPPQIDSNATILSYKKKTGDVVVIGYNLNEAEISGSENRDKIELYNCSDIDVDTSNDGEVPDEILIVNKEPCDCENKSHLGKNDYSRIEQHDAERIIISEIRKK